MAVQSNLKNMALCLSLVCLVCSALLGGVYAVTAEPIAQTNANLLKASIQAVLPQGGELSEAKTVEVDGTTYEYYESVADGVPVAYAVKSVTSGFGGALTLMVGVTPDGTIYNTSVLSHTETPGLGAKCTTDEGFMAQWKGFDPSQKILSVKKDGGDVDAITAATITSRAFSKAVDKAYQAFEANKEKYNKTASTAVTDTVAENENEEGGTENE